MSYTIGVIFRLCYIVGVCYIALLFGDFCIWLSQVFNPGTRMFLGVNMNILEGALILVAVIVPAIMLLWTIFVPSLTEADKEIADNIKKILVDNTAK
jgi:hypothetical protein